MQMTLFLLFLIHSLEFPHRHVLSINSSQDPPVPINAELIKINCRSSFIWWWFCLSWSAFATVVPRLATCCSQWRLHWQIVQLATRIINRPFCVDGKVHSFAKLIKFGQWQLASRLWIEQFPDMGKPLVVVCFANWLSQWEVESVNKLIFP